MPKAPEANREYASYEDYKKAFFPRTKDRPAGSEDPAAVGTELAKRALRKLRLAIS